MKNLKHLTEAIESGDCCPKCRSNNIESTGIPDLDGNSVINKMNCLVCDLNYTEIYYLARIYESE